MFKKIAITTILLGLFFAGSLIAAEKSVGIQLYVHIANPEHSGTVHVQQMEIFGYPDEIDTQPYDAGQTEVWPSNGGTWQELWVYEEADGYYPWLDVWAYSAEQGYSNTYRVDLDFPDQIEYDAYLLFPYNEGIFRSIDLMGFSGSEFNLNVSPDKRYFQLTGTIRLILCGPDHGEPE